MKPPSIAAAYVCLYPILCEAAREKGYALAIHGSLQRDLDVVAVPWIDEAAPIEELVGHIKNACNGLLVEGREGRDPTPKPHGRIAWSIHLDSGIYIDLSVMPRLEAK